MNAGGKPLIASLSLHGAAVLLAGTLVVHPPGIPATKAGNKEPLGISLVVEIPSEYPERSSTDKQPIAFPPEPAVYYLTASLPFPALPPTQLPSAPLDLVATTAPSALLTTNPPATTGKKSPRQPSPISSATRSGGASRSAGSTGNGAGVAVAAYSPARYARCPAPLFPVEARKARIFGTVLLLVEVDENGRPTKVSIRHSSGHEVLDSAALRAVRAWRFESARLNGKQVSARLEIPVRFAAS